MTSADVSAVVIGGGIAGVSAAAELAGAGAAVTLLEQGVLAAAASGKNTGTLLQQTEPEVAELLRETAAIYSRLAEGPVDFGFRCVDELLLARDESQLETAREKAELLRALGVQAEFASGEDVGRAYPFLARSAGGVVVGDTYVLEPEATVLALAARARRAGAAIRTGVRAVQVAAPGGRVGGVLTDRGPVAADLVVLATGPWLSELLPAAPVGAGRGWLLRTERLPFRLDCVVEELSWPDQDTLGRVGRPRPLGALVDERPDEPLADAVVLCPQQDGGALLGAAMTLSLYDTLEGHGLPSRLAARAVEAVPALATVGIRRAWSGLRPTAPDGLPVVGAVDGVEGLYVHGGHASIGMQAAPATAAWLTAAVFGEPVPAAYAALDPGRFEPLSPAFPRTRLEELWA